MNYLLSALIAASITGATFLITQEQVTVICQTANTRLTRLEQQRDAELLKAASTQWQLDGNTGSPTEQQLVEARLIDPAFLSREKAADALTDCAAQ